MLKRTCPVCYAKFNASLHAPYCSWKCKKWQMDQSPSGSSSSSSSSSRSTEVHVVQRSGRDFDVLNDVARHVETSHDQKRAADQALAEARGREAAAQRQLKARKAKIEQDQAVQKATRAAHSAKADARRHEARREKAVEQVQLNDAELQRALDHGVRVYGDWAKRYENTRVWLLDMACGHHPRWEVVVDLVPIGRERTVAAEYMAGLTSTRTHEWIKLFKGWSQERPPFSLNWHWPRKDAEAIANNLRNRGLYARAKARGSIYADWSLLQLCELVERLTDGTFEFPPEPEEPSEPQASAEPEPEPMDPAIIKLARMVPTGRYVVTRGNLRRELHAVLDPLGVPEDANLLMGSAEKRGWVITHTHLYVPSGAVPLQDLRGQAVIKGPPEHVSIGDVKLYCPENKKGMMRFLRGLSSGRA